MTAKAMDETLVSPPVAETQNQATEQAETPEVATPEPEQQQPDAEKATKGLLRRIDRLTAAKYQSVAEADAARREAEQLRQRLAQYEQQPEQETLTPERVLPIARQMAEQIREQEVVRASVQTVLAKGKTLEGFDSACNVVNEELPFYDQRGAPTHFLKAVLDGDAPEKVLHHLGTNPDVAAELAGLSPTKLARRLERIEMELMRPPEPKQSTAPKALTPLRGVRRDEGGISDDLSTAEWIKRRNAQVRG